MTGHMTCHMTLTTPQLVYIHPFSGFSVNSETNVSEFIENLEKDA